MSDWNAAFLEGLIYIARETLRDLSGKQLNPKEVETLVACLSLLHFEAGVEHTIKVDSIAEIARKKITAKEAREGGTYDNSHILIAVDDFVDFTREFEHRVQADIVPGGVDLRPAKEGEQALEVAVDPAGRKFYAVPIPPEMRAKNYLAVTWGVRL